MKIMFYKYILCFLIFSALISEATAQTAAPNQKVTPPSPEVSAMQRYGEYGCSSYTGMTDVSIPIFEVISSQLKLPISLKYISNGRKVVDDKSSVGSGWMLDAGGIVSRTIFGMPDMDEAWAYSLKSADEYYDYKANYDTLSMLCAVGRDYLDSEYDIYSYSFGSYSGSFIIDQKKDKNNFILLKQQPIKIEYGNQYFTLFDEYGNQYKFGLNGRESMKSNNDKLAVTGWYLSEIISADKQDTITLKYNTYLTKNKWYNLEYVVEDNCNGAKYGDKDPSYGDKSGWKENEYNTCKISEISYSRGKVKFNYKSLNKDLLESIAITNIKGEIIKTVTLESNLKGDTSKGGAFFLDKLRFIGQDAIGQEQIYKFYYYTPYEFDPRNCDWWGYANKLTYQDALGLPYTKYSIFRTSYGTSDLDFGTKGAKDANPAAMVSGMIKEIVYPTGGKTSFEYEPNKFSNSGNVITGNGLRLSKVTNDDGYGNLNMKTYKYGNEGSGYHPVLPRLEYYSRIFHFVYATENCTEYKAQLPCYGGFRQRRYNTGPASSVSEQISKPVQYEFVTEYLGDTLSNNNGKTEYKYAIGAGGNVTGFQSYNGIPSESSIQPADLWHYHVSTISDYSKGCLLEKIYWKKESGIYKEVYKIINHYDFKDVNRFTGMRVINLIISDGAHPKRYNSGTERIAKDFNLPVFLYSNYSITSGACILNKTEEYIDGVLKLSENSYNSNYLPKTITTTDSRNIKKKTAFTYSTDIDNVQGSIFSDMSKNYMTGVPVETVESIYKDNLDYTTNATICLFKNLDGVIKPEKVYSLSCENPITNYQKLTANGTLDSRMESQMDFEKYDTKGNLKQFTTRDGITESYLWSYNYQYPIIEVKGASYDDIKKALGYTSDTQLESLAITLYPSDSQIETIGSTLRTYFQGKPVEVKTYTYKPLVGIQSMTDPRGVVTKYNYDSFSRLIDIRDHNGNVVESYNYHYQNK